ncbi:NAD-binding protein [Natronobacterium gregoryi]|uniref:Kef-type K+ ransport system, predicted NAD-binding component n=2 Tax=Natronobacterium gregoryi TaxID=44930 RepID=L0AET8_NATGS|nr:NAD-binding protein [Natronobacterium gregoryi]AFZ72356.1 Kef-type K+ ransport system, predicted NAD-binding component [Natronobacterium gregoryi SP2]ELY64259.1 TrkA-N domain-containing protein [Natronobacterium gregoryi SP2]PLK20329.1 potassium channel protein [Natronobacterium gregoryi SP2]SFJ22470.1 voltage-gated potassium channel [Natronobacterium gregoryi]
MVGEALLERLPKNWKRVVTVRAAIGLALAVALLSVLTGVHHIGQEAVDHGPLAGMVPGAVQRLVGFTGALTGFLMVGSALALRRGLRAGWYATLILMPVTAIQGLLQVDIYSIPLVILSLLSIPILLFTRKRFEKSLSLTATQLGAGGALFGVQIYGTFGAYGFRDDFDGIETLLDAFYFTLITSSTVGYGNIVPETPEAMLFTMSVVVLGVASFGIAIGALVGPAIQARITKTLGKMSDSQLELLEDHLLVLGYGKLTAPIVDELADSNRQFVVVTDDATTDDLSSEDIAVVAGDPSDEGPLERAKIGRATGIVVATDEDARDALAILTASQLAPDTRIVAAATDRENTKKLERAGADTVISPSVLGGHLLIRSALGSDDSELIEQILGNE